MKRPGSDFFYFYSIMKKKYKKKVWRIKMQSAAELKSLLNRIDHKGIRLIKIQKESISFRDMNCLLTMCRVIHLRHRQR